MTEIADPYSYQCDMTWGAGHSHKNRDGTYGHQCQYDMYHYEDHVCYCGMITPVHIEREYGRGSTQYYNSPRNATNHYPARENYSKRNTTKKRTPARDADGRILQKRRLQG